MARKISAKKVPVQYVDPATKETVKFNLPGNLAQCADLLFSTREERLAVQKKVEALQKQESLIREHLIATLPKGDASGIAGKLARVTVVTKDKPVIKDYEKFYTHIRKTGAFELLQRRVSEAAVRERWEDGKDVPGVEHFTVVDLSMNKV